jgi:hypothetical protein
MARIVEFVFFAVAATLVVFFLVDLTYGWVDPMEALIVCPLVGVGICLAGKAFMSWYSPLSMRH